MEDKLHNFFTENDFNTLEPHSGHMNRFEKRLQGAKPQKKRSWGWMSVAASVVLLVGFFLGQNINGKRTLSDTSQKMQEVETYFVNTINVELQEIEKSRSLDTEKIIEEALDKLEDLEDKYKVFLKELNDGGDHTSLISEMISNYQKRLEVLQNTLNQIQQIKNSKTLGNEIYS